MVMRVRDIDDPPAIRTENGMIVGTCSSISQSLDGASVCVNTENVVDVVYHSSEGDLLSIRCPRWMPVIYIVMRQLFLVCTVDMNDVDF